jgi:hypothetical protein
MPMHGRSLEDYRYQSRTMFRPFRTGIEQLTLLGKCLATVMARGDWDQFGELIAFDEVIAASISRLHTL